MPLYDTVKVALEQLEDDRTLEKVAYYVLRQRLPNLRLTSATADLGMDAYSRLFFATTDEVGVSASLQKKWRPKLADELRKNRDRPSDERPDRMFFVTTQRITEAVKRRQIADARTQGVDVELVSFEDLEVDLEREDLSWVAERYLGVRPRAPRVLLPADEALDGDMGTDLGALMPFVGRHRELEAIAAFIGDSSARAPRALVVEGRGGLGKTRLALEGASRMHRTFFAPSATYLSVADFSVVPLNEPAVVVIDDAHRRADLAAVAALISDSRYANVKVILTVRPGLSQKVLSSTGLDRHASLPPTLSLQPLERREIDAIITAHGINDDRFIKTVIDLAEGSPLIAHAAAAQASQDGVLTWRDATDILRRYVRLRLLPSEGQHPHEHRAVATALAVLGTVDDAEQLPSMARAVRSLPQERDRLETVLDDLADSGLAQTAPVSARDPWRKTYSLGPHLAAPLLIADALQQQRGGLNVAAALPVLGRSVLRATARPGEGGEPHSVTITLADTSGPLGIGRLSPLPSDRPSVDISRLATQLQVLTQAALQADDGAAMHLLHQAALHLLPEQGDVGTWRDMLSIAEQVIPAAPALIGDVATGLLQQWPLSPSPEPSWFSRWPSSISAAQRERNELLSLLEQVKDLISRVGGNDVPASIHLLLSLATAADEPLGSDAAKFVAGAVRALCLPGNNSDASGAAIHQRREQVLRYVVAWAHEKHIQARLLPPLRAGDPSPEHDGEQPLPLAGTRATLAALGPLLSPALELTELGSRASADTFVLSSAPLPDEAGTHAELAAAADAAAWLVQTLDTRAAKRAASRAGGLSANPEAEVAVVRDVVTLPATLRYIARRPLPYSGLVPSADRFLPAGSQGALYAAADTVLAAIVTRWAHLPLWARHAAAATALRSQPGPVTSVGRQAASGDLLARAVRGDRELRQLSVLVPLHAAHQLDPSEHPDEYPRAGHGQREQARRRHEAVARRLADHLPWLEVLQLLEQSVYLNHPGGLDLRACFAEHAAARLGHEDADRLVQHLLQQSPVPAEGFLLRGLTHHHGALVLIELTQACHHERGGALALTFLRCSHPLPLPMPQVNNLLEALHTHISTATADDAVEGGGKADMTATSELANVAGGGWSLQQCYLIGANLALELLDDERLGGAAARVDRLLRLGQQGPAQLTPVVLRRVTHPLRHLENERLTLPGHEQVHHIIDLLSSYLGLCDELSVSLHDDEDLALAVRTLAIHAPDELAHHLAPRLISPSTTHSRWPLAWQYALRELNPAQRAPFAAALQQHVDTLRTAQELEEWVAFEVDKVLSELTTDLAQANAQLLQFATGSAAQRRRALAAVSAEGAWRRDGWAQVLIALLKAGISDREHHHLLDVITLHSFGPDIQQHADARLEILTALEADEHPAVIAYLTQARALIHDAVNGYAAENHRRSRGY